LSKNEYLRRIIVADTASKTGVGNDFTSVQLWGALEGNRAHMIDTIRGKWEMPRLIDECSRFWEKHKKSENGPLVAFYIEDNASGTGLIQTLKQKGVVVVPIRRKPGQNKVVRVENILPAIESGMVSVEAEKPWVQNFIAECANFTLTDSHKNDDQVDAMADAISVITGGKLKDDRHSGVVAENKYPGVTKAFEVFAGVAKNADGDIFACAMTRHAILDKDGALKGVDNFFYGAHCTEGAGGIAKTLGELLLKSGQKKFESVHISIEGFSKKHVDSRKISEMTLHYVTIKPIKEIQMASPLSQLGLKINVWPSNSDAHFLSAISDGHHGSAMTAAAYAAYGFNRTRQ